MIQGARNAKRPWEPQEEQQLREMAEPLFHWFVLVLLAFTIIDYLLLPSWG